VKTVVIVNPVSGRGRAKQLIPTIERILRASDLDFDLLQSERTWHTADLAEQAARGGYEIVITAGGDGTANEAINGLMRARADGFDQTALGMLSIGTGNDFAASLGLPVDLGEAVNGIVQNKRRRVDIGLMKGCDFPEGRYFGNCVGIGFDAAGTIQSRKITWAGGMLAYLIAVIQTIFWYYKAPTLQIEMDEETITQPSLLASIMNGKRLGGGFWMAPASLPDDGLFDLCIAQEVSRARMFSFIPHFIKGTQATQPEIKMRRSKNVKVIATRGSMPVHMDGEIVGEACTELTVEILPGELEIIGYTEEQ
jgi:YegS/Rv2252/BmrU family lipid kinase